MSVNVEKNYTSVAYFHHSELLAAKNIGVSTINNARSGLRWYLIRFLRLAICHMREPPHFWHFLPGVPEVVLHLHF
jgi:hypothetical protein